VPSLRQTRGQGSAEAAGLTVVSPGGILLDSTCSEESERS